MKKLIKIFTIIFLFLMGLATSPLTSSAEAASKKVAAGTVMKKIKSSGKIVVGMSADYPPMEFTKNVNGKNKFVGVDVELAKQIAKDLGVKLEIKNMDFDSLLVALETGKIDVIISGMTPTSERRRASTSPRSTTPKSLTTSSSTRPTRLSTPQLVPSRARRLGRKLGLFNTPV